MSFNSRELLTAAVRIVSESFKTIRLARFIHDIAAILMNLQSSAMIYVNNGLIFVFHVNTIWLQNTLNTDTFLWCFWSLTVLIHIFASTNRPF